MMMRERTRGRDFVALGHIGGTTTQQIHPELYGDFPRRVPTVNGTYAGAEGEASVVNALVALGARFVHHPRRMETSLGWYTPDLELYEDVSELGLKAGLVEVKNGRDLSGNIPKALEVGAQVVQVRSMFDGMVCGYE